jgi:fucose permease
MEKMNLKAAVAALMAVFTLGIIFIILGAISVELMDSLSIDAAQFGTLVLGLFLTSCIVQLFMGPMVDKVGYKPVALSGFILAGFGMLLLAVAPGFPVLLAATILLGTSAMALNTVGNTLLPVVLFNGKDPARASNFGNAFYALGFILTPLLVIFMLKTLSLGYTSALIAISIIAFIFFLFSLTVSFPKVSTGFKFAMAFKALSSRSVIVAAIALFCYISLEVSMGTWARKLMEELFIGSGNSNAASETGLVLSLFGVAMMIGRLITSTIKNLTAIGPKLIILASFISLLSIILMIVAKGPVLGIVAIFLAAIAFAPIFPTIVGVTFSKFEPGLYGSIFGIIFSFGLLGGTFVPKFIGNLSVGSSVQQSLSIAAAMAAILLVISLFISRTGK